MDAIRDFKEIALGSRLTRLGEWVMKDIQKVYSQLDIDFDAYLFPIFKTIAGHSNITNSEIRQLLHVTQPAITQALTKLDHKGLVRFREDKSDKRKTNITLSRKGEKLLIVLGPIWKVMEETVEEYTKYTSNSLLDHLDILEDRINHKPLSKTIMEKIAEQSLKDIHIVPFDEQYTPYFYDFNIEWLETYFYVEPHDKEVLSNAKSYIIDNGGQIFFAMIDKEIVGTVALIKIREGVYELSKMAVPPKHRGKQIGQKLMQYCIDFANEQQLESLILYSNTKLENAIYIYRKYGFKEIPLEKDSIYERGNIKMELKI